MSKDELSKLMMVGSELRTEIQETKRASAPKPDKHKDKNKKSTGWWRKKCDGVTEVIAEESSRTNDAP